MQFVKINCTQCSHYQKCPQKTRMYINYCGGDMQKVKREIDEAAFDCRERGGLLFTQTILSNEWKTRHLEPASMVSF